MPRSTLQYPTDSCPPKLLQACFGVIRGAKGLDQNLRTLERAQKLKLAPKLLYLPSKCEKTGHFSSIQVSYHFQMSSLLSLHYYYLY